MPMQKTIAIGKFLTAYMIMLNIRVYSRITKEYVLIYICEVIKAY